MAKPSSKVTPSIETSKTQCKTGICTVMFIRMSNPEVVERKGKTLKKFSITLAYPQSDLEAHKRLKRCAINAGIEKFKSKDVTLKKIKNGVLTFPIMDGDRKADKQGYGPDVWYFNAKCYEQPISICDHRGKEMQPDDERLYKGCKVIAKVGFRYYKDEETGGEGISCAILAMQWAGNGERLDGRLDATKEFEPLDIPDDEDDDDWDEDEDELEEDDEDDDELEEDDDLDDEDDDEEEEPAPKKKKATAKKAIKRRR